MGAGGTLGTLFPGTKTVLLSLCHWCNQLKMKFRISGKPTNLSNSMKVVQRNRLRQSHGKLLPKLLVDISERKYMQANEDVRRFPFWEATLPALENWLPCLRSWGVQEVWGGALLAQERQENTDHVCRKSAERLGDGPVLGLLKTSFKSASLCHPQSSMPREFIRNSCVWWASPGRKIKRKSQKRKERDRDREKSS